WRTPFPGRGARPISVVGSIAGPARPNSARGGRKACRLTGSGGYATCTCVPKIGDPYSLTVGRHLGMATVGRHLGMPSAVPRFGSQRVQKGLPGGSRSRHVL